MDYAEDIQIDAGLSTRVNLQTRQAAQTTSHDNECRGNQALSSVQNSSARTRRFCFQETAQDAYVVSASTAAVK